MANLVGRFQIRRHKTDDIIDVGDGTDHVHIDWRRIKRFTVGDFHGEGMLSFFDGDECLFRFYNPAGPFSSEISALADTELLA